MTFDPHAKGRALFALAEQWEGDGIEPRDILHTFAQAFGHAMSRYLPADLAVAFMEQELARVRAVALSAGAETETRQ